MKVTITYFKPSGKYYMQEEEDWPEDPTHYSGWRPFSEVPRVKDLNAVCLETPLGFPCMRPATESP